MDLATILQAEVAKSAAADPYLSAAKTFKSSAAAPSSSTRPNKGEIWGKIAAGLLGGVSEGYGRARQKEQNSELVDALTNAIRSRDSETSMIEAVQADPRLSAFELPLQLSQMQKEAEAEEKRRELTDKLALENKYNKGRVINEAGEFESVPGFNTTRAAEQTAVSDAQNASDTRYAGAKAASTAAGRLSQELKYGGAIAESKALGTGRGERANEALKAATTAVDPKEIRKTETSLRKEYGGLAPVKSFLGVSGGYRAALNAFKDDTRAGDLNMVYAAAKMFDPTGSVREGEAATVYSSNTIPDQIKGLLRSTAEGKGRLNPQARQALLHTLKGRYSAAKSEVALLAAEYGRIAEEQGANPRNVTLGERQSADQIYKSVVGGGAKPTEGDPMGLR